VLGALGSKRIHQTPADRCSRTGPGNTRSVDPVTAANHGPNGYPLEGARDSVRAEQRHLGVRGGRPAWPVRVISECSVTNAGVRISPPQLEHTVKSSQVTFSDS
jgi:hypothetical protein